MVHGRRWRWFRGRFAFQRLRRERFSYFFTGAEAKGRSGVSRGLRTPLLFLLLCPAVASAAPRATPGAASSGWTLGLVVIAPEDLTSAKNFMFADLQARRHGDVQVVALVADGASSRLLKFSSDGAPPSTVEFMNGDVREDGTLEAFGRHLSGIGARRTAVVFWGHGRGWRGFGGDARARGSRRWGWRLVDGSFEQAMSALRDGLGKRIDVLGFDACLMGAWEVASAVSPFARFLVASPELVPLSGWPLGAIVEEFAAAPAQAPRALSLSIVKHFDAAGRRHTTLSVFDLDRIPAVSNALDGLAHEALTSGCAFEPEWLDETLTYRAPGAADLGALASRIADECGPKVRKHAAALEQELARARVGRSCKKQYCEGVGLSVHAPRGSEELTYASASWNRFPAWSRWIHHSRSNEERAEGMTP